MHTVIRSGTTNDLKAIHQMVIDLAIYEKEPDAVTATLSDYRRDYRAGIFDFLVAEQADSLVGMAIYYMTYSTWKGRMLYLEDFFVEPAFRRQGVGHRLFDAFLDIAKEKKCNLVKWQVLDWNEPALSFYEQYDAEIETNWYNGKLYLNQDDR